MLFYSRLISLLLMGVLCYVQNSPMFCCTHHITVQLMHFWHVSALSSMHCSLYSVCSAAHNCMYVCCAWLKKGRGGVREGVGGQSRAEHFGRKCSFLFLASTLTKKLPHLFCPKCIFLYWNCRSVTSTRLRFFFVNITKNLLNSKTHWDVLFFDYLNHKRKNSRLGLPHLGKKRRKNTARFPSL